MVGGWGCGWVGWRMNGVNESGLRVWLMGGGGWWVDG